MRGCVLAGALVAGVAVSATPSSRAPRRGGSSSGTRTTSKKPYRAGKVTLKPGELKFVVGRPQAGVVLY